MITSTMIGITCYCEIRVGKVTGMHGDRSRPEPRSTIKVGDVAAFGVRMEFVKLWQCKFPFFNHQPHVEK
jgi:hypothetical protein